MIMQLFNNKELLYIVIGLLVILAFVLVYIINNNKQKNVKEDKVKVVKIDASDEPEGEKSKADIEIMLEQMQRDLADKSIEAVKNFEDEQEEKSIISYQELLKVNKKDSFESDSEEIDEPIETETKIVEEPTKKFKTTEFISPIYGRLDSKADYPSIPNFKEKRFKEESIIEEERKPIVTKSIQIEKKIIPKPSNNEIKKNDEFLKTLKDFRKKLE